MNRMNIVVIGVLTLGLLFTNLVMAVDLSDFLVCGNDPDYKMWTSWADGTHKQYIADRSGTITGEYGTFSPNGRFFAYHDTGRYMIQILDRKHGWKLVKEFPGGMPALTNKECYYDLSVNLEQLKIWHQPIIGGEAKKLTDNYDQAVCEHGPSAGGNVVQWATFWLVLEPIWTHCSPLKAITNPRKHLRPSIMLSGILSGMPIRCLTVKTSLIPTSVSTAQ